MRSSSEGHQNDLDVSSSCCLMLHWPAQPTYIAQQCTVGWLCVTRGMQLATSWLRERTEIRERTFQGSTIKFMKSTVVRRYATPTEQQEGSLRLGARLTYL